MSTTSNSTTVPLAPAASTSISSPTPVAEKPFAVEQLNKKLASARQKACRKSRNSQWFTKAKLQAKKFYERPGLQSKLSKTAENPETEKAAEEPAESQVEANDRKPSAHVSFQTPQLSQVYSHEKQFAANIAEIVSKSYAQIQAEVQAEVSQWASKFQQHSAPSEAKPAANA